MKTNDNNENNAHYKTTRRSATQTRRETMEEFEKELTTLINKHSIENAADAPDFILAGMICRMIEAIGPSVKKTLDWHGCDSICHPSPNTSDKIPAASTGKDG